MRASYNPLIAAELLKMHYLASRASGFLATQEQADKKKP